LLSSFPVLSAVAGDFLVARNVFLVSLQATALKDIGGVVSIAENNIRLVITFSSLSQVLCAGGFRDDPTDLQVCIRANFGRTITSSSAIAVTSSLLTYAGENLVISSNAVLATIILPSLSTVTGYLSIVSNPSLTLAHLPKLTFIGDRIFFLENNAAFRIPSGPPDAPTGGLVVTGSLKGTNNCHLNQGSTTGGPYETCP
jgi:hypothetical protein